MPSLLLKLLFIFFVLCFVLLLPFLFGVFGYNLIFLPIHNIVFGIFTTFLAFLISLKAHRLYSRTSDCRMALIAASFLCGGLFEILHFLNSNSIGAQFSYWYFEALSYLSGILISIVYMAKPPAENKIDFQKTVYYSYAIFLLFGVILMHYFGVYISSVLLLLPLEVTYMGLFILASFIYADIRKSNNFSIFSPFVLGVFFLTFSDFFEATLYYSQSQYRFIVHFNDILALSFLYVGLEDLLLKSDYFSIKNKFIFYNGLLISAFYLLVIFYSSVVFGFDFHSYFKYLFFFIFLILIITGYILASKVTYPIAYIISKLKENIPGRDFVSIDVISDDEIGTLSNVFNENAQIAYSYTQKMKNYAIYEQRLANRERLLRNLAEVIRSSLDIKETKQIIVNEVGRFLNADRCYFRAFDTKKKIFLAPDVEYLKSSSVGSLLDAKVSQEGLALFFEEAQKRKDFSPLILNQSVMKSKYLENSALFNYFEQAGIKSDVAIPLWGNDNELYFLVLHYVEDLESVSDEDVELMETLARQSVTAINQSKLYEQISVSANKERVLREIISDIRTEQNIGDVYLHITKKIASIFNADRVIFLEPPSYENQNVNVRYEYKKLDSQKSMLGVSLPQNIVDDIERSYKKNKTIVVSEVKLSKAEESKFLQFYGIRSLVGTPFIRYNSHVKVLGMLVMCSSSKREWQESEIDLIKAIAESVVSIVWDIVKITEIDNMRDTFISTLAHDLQVPLVGEHTALEFLVKADEKDQMGDYREIIEELLKNNERLSEQLKKMLEIYYYESGKKALELQKQDFYELLKVVIRKFTPRARHKNIKLSLDFDKNISTIKVDEKEILKVFDILMDNAIKFSRENGRVHINVSLDKGIVTTCITDSGEGVDEETSKKMFEKHEMSQVLSREIGGGFSLYLCNQILLAHKASLFFSSEAGEGATFCFKIPMKL